jgi:outer membrane protein
MKLPRPLPLSLALAALFSGSVQAQSLVDLVSAARSWDAAYQAARAQHDASLAKAEQARAGLLPTAGLTAGMTRSDLDSRTGATATGRSYTTQNAAVSASQPLYRPVNTLSWEQGLKQVELAKAQLLTAEQDLIVRVSQAYFDVLASQDSLTFVKAQKTAVAEQLAAAKRNFEVGTSTITDSREAQARFDLVLAQEIAAENDLRVKKLALDQLTGKTDAQPRPLATPVALPALQPADVGSWVQQSADNHPGIRQARVGLDVAQLETRKAESGHKPTLDLTASYGITRYPDGNPSSGAPTTSSRSSVGTIGLSFNLPLFAGYAVQNRVKETLALEEKARADLDAAQRNVAQGTRTAFFGVQSGLGQVRALEAAETSSQSALDANKLGYQVGVRINIDVLNSQSQLYQTKRDLAKARYDVLVGGLKLRQASGTLKDDDLQAVNALLAK